MSEKKEHPPEAVDEKGELKCAAFGLDDAGKPGIDDGTEECQACLEQEPELYEQCRQECAKATAEMGEGAEAPVETPAAEEQPEQPVEAPETPEDQSPELAGEEPAPEGAEEKGDSEMAKAKKEAKKAAKKKAKAKADKPKRVSRLDILARLAKQSKARTTNEYVAEILAASENDNERSIHGLVGKHLRFLALMGYANKDANGCWQIKGA